MTLRVFVVSGAPGLAPWIDWLPGHTVVGQSHAGDELGAVVAATSPDVIVWDADPESGMPPLHKMPVPVVALADNWAAARSLLLAGARGCVHKDIDGPHLAAVLEAAAQGFVILDPAFAPWGQTHRDEGSESWVEELTPRELDVLQWVAEGLPNREIAQRLGVSENTVKFHTGTIYSKLAVHSRTEAVARAVRLGLITI